MDEFSTVQPRFEVGRAAAAGQMRGRARRRRWQERGSVPALTRIRPCCGFVGVIDEKAGAGYGIVSFIPAIRQGNRSRWRCGGILFGSWFYEVGIWSPYKFQLGRWRAGTNS